MASITISINSPTLEWTETIDGDQITIGRGQGFNNTIKIPDPRVSRTHGQITLETDGYWYVDSGSSHGSQFNGQPLSSPIKLNSGDLIGLGNSTITIIKADISDPILDELFDVHVLDQVDLGQDTPPNRPVAQISIIDAIDTPPPSSKQTADTGLLSVNNWASTLIYSPLEEALAHTIKCVLDQRNYLERGVILLNDPETNILSVAAHHPDFTPAYSTSLIKKTFESNHPFVWNIKHSSNPSKSIRELNIKQGIYTPLKHGESILGIMCLDSSQSAHEIPSDASNVFASLGTIMSAILYTKLKK